MTESYLTSLFDKLEKFLKTETVIGEPFQVGSITFVPIISATFGLLGGMGSEGKDAKSGEGSGSGGGLGCKITPNAVLVIKGEEVNLIPLNKQGSLERIVEMVPDIIKKIDWEQCKKGD
jgi:uncharacterized spore protein YtfJ